MGSGGAGSGDVVLGIDLNPLDWLGGAAAGVATDGWKAAMVGLWSAGLWLLQLSFKVVDAFTTPDVSASGPLTGALPTTLWLGGAVAVVLMFVQVLVALVRRDGQSLGRLLLGIVQFGVVWAGFLAVDGALVVAAGALAKGILSSMLHVGSWAQFSVSDSWPRKVDDATAATVLGICALLLLIPAAFGYLLIMLVREVALVILLATTPVSAAGLLSDATKAWFWKSLRWLFACLLIAPAAALILGVGVSLSNGVVQGAGTDTVAAAGTAVIGCVLVAIGAVCPMVLFKLLAFVDPGTGSGAALRQSISDAGGVSGLLRGGVGGSAAGSGAASAAVQGDGGGRSQGEAAAEARTSSRVAGMLGSVGAVGAGVGAGVGTALSAATRAADLVSDVLGSAGVGDPGYSAGFADNAARRPSRPGGGGTAGSGSADPAAPSGDVTSSPGAPDPGTGGPGGGSTPGGPAPSGPAPSGPAPGGPAPPPAPPPPSAGGVGAGTGAGAEAAGVAL